jgi:hypothetical protein
MNGNTGITPTVELATTNGGNSYPYPIYPMMGGYGNNGFGYGGDWIWIILLFALFGGWGNNGNGGFFNGGFDNGYAWLSNGQKEIMQNTNNGFDTLHLSNQLDTVNSGIYSLSNQLCNCCGDITNAINTTAYNAEISANNRQIADMQQNFALQSQLAQCCCDNRLATANLTATVLSENCADRALISDGLKDILINNTANTQKILDQLCQDKIDAKNDIISQLRQELLYARGQASQIEQTALLRQGQEAEVDALYNRLSNCPVPTTPVYGRTPIFTCNSNSCGCNGYATNLI